MELKDKDRLLLNAAQADDLKGVVKALADGADIHADDDYVLRWVAAYGRSETLALLLENGADVNAGDDCALRWGAEYGDTRNVALLLEKGADIHVDNDYALFIAARNGHKEIVELLLEKGADVHARNDWAVRAAAKNGRMEIVALLKDWITKHPAPSQQTKKDETSPSAEDAAAEGRTTNMEKQLEELKAAKARAKALGFNRPADLGRTPGGRE